MHACWQFCLSLNNNDLLLLNISQTSTNSNITNNSDNYYNYEDFEPMFNERL